MIHQNFRSKNQTHDHHVLHEKAREPYTSSLGKVQKEKQVKNLENEGIRNVTLKTHDATKESHPKPDEQNKNQSNAVVSDKKNISQLKEQYASSWSKTQYELKSPQEKQEVKQISDYVKNK